MGKSTNSQKPRNPPLTGIDWSLICVAATSAVASSWFAVYMITSQDQRTNYVFGAEHLGIFGRPATAAAERAKSAGIDMTPIGAVAPSARGGSRVPEPVEPLIPPTMNGAPRTPFEESGQTASPAAPAETARSPLMLDSFTVHDVIGDQALIMSPSGLTAVRVGSNLGVAGTVQRFELTRRGWVVVTSRGRLEPVP